MLRLGTADPDLRTVRLSLAVFLEDRFNGPGFLAGEVSVALQGFDGKPLAKAQQGLFLFFGVPPGNYIVEVRSNLGNGLPPYFVPVDLPLALPMPNALWPAFPDLSLADQSLPLHDPTQPAAYRNQREKIRLWPSTAYPFPAGATLVRGTVLSDGAPLADAEVREAGAANGYRTAADGEYVLTFPKLPGSSVPLTLEASHPSHATQQQNVVVRRGFTVAAPDFVMP